MDQVSLVRSKTDLISLIGSYISLKKAGRSLKANCPFHGEKTPSFIVSPERQIWHCFGCGKGGDCFTFLMEYEHMEFPEALRILAGNAGVVLQDQKFDSGLATRKENIYKINHLAGEFYHYLLTRHKIGERALDYLENKRGVKSATIKTYQLGFAPQNGNGLVTYLTKKKGFKPEDIVEAGLATKKGSFYFDFFQGRIMFPLFDHRGNAIGFAGRVFQGQENISKYINTRETIVYHKGLTFFGLNSAKEAIKKEGQAILMEGELDVISSFQEGITNTVAVKGTALTEDQVNLLARFTPKVTLCFDADSAGQEALKRSVSLLEKKGLTTTVVRIPGGKDPDEAVKADATAFKKAVKNDIGIYDFLLEEALKKYSPTTVEGKKKIGDELLPLLSAIDNEIVKEHYLQNLAGALKTTVEVLQKEIEKRKRKEIVKNPVFIAKKARTREEILEEYLLALILQSEDCKKDLESLSDFISSYTWLTPSLGKILEHLALYALSHESVSGKDIVNSLPQELLPNFDTCFLLPLPQIEPEKYKEEIKKCSNELYTLFTKKQIKLITDTIKQKEKEGEAQDLDALQKQLSVYLTQLSRK